VLGVKSTIMWLVTAVVLDNFIDWIYIALHSPAIVKVFPVPKGLNVSDYAPWRLKTLKG
jgi:hypothetical protein